MPIVVLISLIVALTLVEQPLFLAPALPAWLAVPAVGVYLIVAAVLAAAGTVWTLRTAAADGSVLSPRPLRRHRWMGLLGHIYLVVGLAGVLLSGYRTVIVTELGLMRVPLAGAMLAWAPFAVALLITWALDYPFYKAVRLQLMAASGGDVPAVRVWRLEEFLLYNFRHYVLLMAVPVGLIVLWGDLVRLYVCPLVPPSAAEAVLVLGSLAGTAAIFVVSPAILVRIWRTSPLPPGRLRDGLVDLCRRMKLGYRNILIWHSGGAIANAAVMGLIGPIRYVLLSDAMLANMDERGVRAVFAHEAGHIRHHHIVYSVLFAVAATGLCAAAAQQVAEMMGWGEEPALVLMTLLLAAAWAFGFGWLSRKFERQSDVSATRLADSDSAPDGTVVFCGALRRIAQLNGIPFHQHNWRHGSIASRIDYLMSMGGPAGSPPAIDRQVALAKLGLWVALAAAVVVNIAQFLASSPPAKGQ
jgi:STE24 endopeptidase